MKTPYVGVAILALGAAACQLLVGIGERDHLPAGPDGAIDGAPPATVTAPSDGAILSADAGCGVGLSACDGSCVDLASDKESCGGCGHRCVTSVCIQRACKPELVPTTSRGPVLALVNGELYFRTTDDFTGGGTLRAISISSGTERDVIAMGEYASIVPLGGTRALLADSVGDDARLRVVDLATGMLERTLFDSPQTGDVRGVSVHADDVFFTTRSDVRHVRLDGTELAVVHTVDPLTEGVSGATPAIDFDDRYVYFGVEDAKGVWRLQREPGSKPIVLDRFGTSEADYIEIEPAGRGLTWLSRGQLRELPLDGGTADAYAIPAPAPHSFARDGSMLYVTSLVNDISSLLRIDLRTRHTTVLGTAIGKFGQIALDATYVYMASYDGGVYRVAR